MKNPKDQILIFLETTIFYSNDKVGIPIDVQCFLHNISLKKIPFKIRFINVLKKTTLTNLMELLNTSSDQIMGVRNCGALSIEQAKVNIHKFLKSQYSDQDFIDLLESKTKFIKRRYYFSKLLNDNIEITSHFNVVRKYKLIHLSWPFKLQKYFEQHQNIETVYDLLKYDPKKLLNEKKIGRITLAQLQEKVIVLLSDSSSEVKHLMEEINVVKFLEKYLDSLDDRTKRILTLRFNGSESASLEEIGKLFGLTRERARQIIIKQIEKIRLHLIPFEEKISQELLSILENKLCPLEYSDFNDISESCKYPQQLIIGLLSETFSNIPFEGYLIKTFNSYLVRPNIENEKYIQLYNQLNGISIPYGKVGLYELYDVLKINSVHEKLNLLMVLFSASEYEFVRSDSNIQFLVRHGSLIKITKEILEGTNHPISVDELLEILQKYYNNETKYTSKVSVVSNLKKDKTIYQLDRYHFGLEKHFAYSRTEWKCITSEVKKFMNSIGRQTNAAEIFNYIVTLFPAIRSKYELVYILRSDNDIIDLGFFNYSMFEIGIDERIKIADSVKEIYLEDSSPKHLMEIHKLISQKRYIRSEGMNCIMKSQNYLHNYWGGYYGLKHQHEKNIEYLVKNENYLAKLIDCEIYPETTFNRILDYIEMEYLLPHVKKTIDDSYFLKKIKDSESGVEFIISKKWSASRITICLLINMKRTLFWDELIWILKDLGVEPNYEFKYKISSNKNIRINNNKIQYINTEVDSKEYSNIANICYGKIRSSSEMVSTDDLFEYINNEVTEVSKNDIIYVLQNDDRFVLIDDQLIMVSQ